MILSNIINITKKVKIEKKPYYYKSYFPSTSNLAFISILSSLERGLG